MRRTLTRAWIVGLLGSMLTQAAPVFTTDMGNSSEILVTAPVLDAVSSGGTWAVAFTNITTAAIVGDTNLTDFALVIDESAAAGSSTGTHVTVTLDSDVDYNLSPVLVEFDMAAARGGGGKLITTTGYGENDSDIVFQVVMNCGNYVYQGLTDSGLQTVVDGPENFLRGSDPYNPSALGQFSLMLDGSTLIYSTPGAGSLSTTNLNAQTKLSSIKWEITGNTEAAQGFWLDNVNVEPTDGNRAPTADAISTNVDEDVSVDITLSGSDPEGSNLTYIVSQPANGTLTTNGALPNVTYTPDLNYFGDDSFTYVVNDGEYDSAPATVSITVNSVPGDLPVADDISVSVIENGSVEITLSGSDPDGGTITSYTVETQPDHGELTGATNVWTYTPYAGYSGDDDFTYTVNNGSIDSAPATVSITVIDLPDGELLFNGDLELNGGITANNQSTTISNWVGTLEGFSPLIRCDLGDGLQQPDAGTVMARLIATSTTGDRGMYQDLASTAWDSSTVFTISFNASEVWWKAAGANNDGVTVSLGDQDGVNSESVYLNLDGTHDGSSNYVTWTEDQTHELTITGAVLIAAGVTAGDDLRLEFASTYTGAGNSIVWVDNISVYAPLTPTTVGDITIEVVSGGTEVALSWLTESGWHYGVAAKANLITGSFDTIITNNVLGTGGVVTVTIPATEGVEFYRAYLDE